MQASCRLTQLRCWVVPGRDSSSSASSGRRVPSLHSKVELNLAAIPPSTLVLPLRRQASKILPGVQDTAVPAVGADCVRHPVFASEASLLPQIRAARHRLRGSARINGVASCFYSKDCACSRSPWYPAQPSVLRSLPWAVPAQAGEAVFRPTAPGSSAAPGSSRSPFRGAPEPAALRFKTASPATLHTLRSFRALGHWETCRRLPHRGQRERRRLLPHRPSRLQDSQQPRPTRDPRPNGITKSTGITRSGGREIVYKFTNGGSG